MQETRVQSLGREDLLEKGMATYSGILAWRIAWTEANKKNIKQTPLHQEKETATIPVFLPREFHGQRSLVGYSPWSCRKSDLITVLDLKQEKILLLASKDFLYLK